MPSSSVQYLYNSSGEWIAFRKGKFVYNSSGNWIGWLPWDEAEVITTNGEYLGHIYPHNRLLKRNYRPYR